MCKPVKNFVTVLMVDTMQITSQKTEDHILNIEKVVTKPRSKNT